MKIWQIKNHNKKAAADRSSFFYSRIFIQYLYATPSRIAIIRCPAGAIRSVPSQEFRNLDVPLCALCFRSAQT